MSAWYLARAASYSALAFWSSLSLGFFGSAGLAGVVATSTAKRPVSSSAFFMNGVVCCQLWLFWPSMISTLILSWAAAGAAVSSAAATPASASTPQRFNMVQPPLRMSVTVAARGVRPAAGDYGTNRGQEKQKGPGRSGNV